MTQFLAFLPLAAPLALLAAAAVARTEPGLRPARALSAAGIASLVALGAALLSVMVLIATGAATSPLVVMEAAVAAGASCRLADERLSALNATYALIFFCSI